MRKLLSLVALLCLLSTFGFSQAQFQHGHAISVLPYTPCVGAPVMISAVDTSGLFSYANHYWSFGDGSNGSSNAYASTVTHTYNAVGTYQVVVYMIDSILGHTDLDTVYITVDSICANHDAFSGKTYFDSNGNGAQDVGEPNYPNRIVEIMPGPAYLTTDANGDFAVNLPAGNYTFRALPGAYYTLTQPSGGAYTRTSTGTGASNAGIDFGFSPTVGINDLVVSHYSNPPVAGFNRMVHVNYSNVGTTVQNATVSLQLDPGYSFISANAGGTFASGTVTWSLPTLLPGTYGSLQATVFVPLGTPLGTPLSNISRIDPTVGDATPSNNIHTLEQLTVASYDPNDKTVQPKGDHASGDIAPGTPLLYTIRFQNTGTYYATNVIVRDTLDADLDQTTLEVLGASHPFTWHNDFGKLAFEFFNIMLPDSNTNEPGSHGFVQFRIAPKSNLALGTELTNTGHIYFDFNAPVVTNTTLNTLANVVSITPTRDMVGLHVAPNPFSNSLQFEFDNLDHANFTLILRDLSGRVVLTESDIAGNRFQIDAGHLPAGMYLYTMRGPSGNVASGKLIKQ